MDGSINLRSNRPRTVSVITGSTNDKFQFTLNLKGVEREVSRPGKGKSKNLALGISR